MSFHEQMALAKTGKKSSDVLPSLDFSK